MRFAVAIVCILVLLMVPADLLSQSSGEQPEENWMLNMGLFHEPVLHHRSDLYSKEEIEEFKRRVAQVNKAVSDDEWEGNYFREDISSVFFSRLTWSKSAGYFSFGIETCFPELRSIEVGSVIPDSDSVRLVSKKAGASSVRYIKVRWGHRRYLVAEESLAAFMLKAAGRYVEPENNEDKRYQLWSDYWMASEKEDDPAPEGLPVLPERYQHLRKAPIASKIGGLVTRRIKSEIQHGWTFYSAPSAVYEITFTGGKKIGLSKGMHLVHPMTKETVFITKVTRTNAKGELVRAIDDETRLDHCLDDEAEKIPCPRLRVGDVYSTPVGSFWDPFP